MPWLVTTGVPAAQAAAFVLGFLALSLGIGSSILRWLRPTAASPSEHWLIAIVIGVGALQFAPFLLGAAGVLSVRNLRILLALCALAFAPEFVRAAKSLWAANRARENGPRSAWFLPWILALLPTLLTAALLAFTPTIDPDGLGYHLTVPKRWLSAGSLQYLPTYAYSNTPMGGEMLFTIGLACVGDTGAKFLHLGLGLLGCIGLYLSGQRLVNRAVGVAAAALYLVGPVGVGGVLGWAYVEGITSSAMIAATLAWLIWFDSRDLGWLRCAALLSGFAVSFKITALLFPLGLGAITFVVLHYDRSPRRPIAEGLLAVARIIPVAALPVIPWLARSLLVTGNPVFPLFAAIIPSRDLSGASAERFETYNRYMVWGSQLGQHWTIGKRKLILLAAASLVALGAAWLFKRLRTPIERGVLVVLASTVLVQLAAVGLYVRYWIPLCAILMLPLLLLFRKIIARRSIQVAGVVVVALLSLLQARTSWRSVNGDVRGLASTAFGLAEPREFLMEHMGYYPIYELANRVLPAQSRVMLSWYCGGFYLDRTTYCAEFVQDTLRFTSWEVFLGDLKRLGVTHIIAPTDLGQGGPGPEVRGGSVGELSRKNQNEYVGRLLTGHGRLLVSAEGQGLFALDGNILQ